MLRIGRDLADMCVALARLGREQALPEHGAQRAVESNLVLAAILARIGPGVKPALKCRQTSKNQA